MAVVAARPRSRVRTLVVLAALVVLVSGCFRYDQRIKIDEDGGGSMQITSLFDPEIAFEEMSGQRVLFDRSPGYDRDSVCEGLKPPDDFGGAFDDGELVPFERDDFCGFRVTIDIEPDVDHTDLMEEIFEPGSTLVKNGDGWEFRAQLDQGIFTDLAESLDLSNFEFGKYSDIAEYRIDIDLPGTAIDGEHNADDVSGGRFIWNIDVLQVPSEIYAVTEPAPPFWESTTTLAGLGALAAGLLVIVGFFVFGGKEKAPKPVASTAGTTPASKEKRSRRRAEPEPAAVDTEPYFDETFGVWVREDAEHGRLWHDTKRNVWVPF